MSPRELVILSLGLAIVAVVLRGLYVAIRGRRGQLRLAIDKNIPRDVDLDALELSELPSGGARVVGRSLDEVNRQNTVLGKARARAAGISLGDTTLDDAAIPVLMDPVQLRSMMPATESIQPLDSAELVADIDSEVNYEDPDDVLLDYQAQERDGKLRTLDDDADELDQDEDEFDATQQRRRATGIDTMSQVAPDYPEDDDDLEEDSYEDDAEEEYEDDLEESSEDDIEEDSDDELDADEDVDDDYYSESLDEVEEDEDNNDADVSEYIDIDDDDLNEFSMTAGERIGFNKPLPPAAKQSNLFQDLEHDTEPTPKQHSTFKPKLNPEPKSKSKTKRKSLFGSFGRNNSNKDNSNKDNASKPGAENPPKQSRVEPEKLVETQKQKPAETVAKPTPRPVEPRAPSEPSEVIVINVMAKPGRVFVGDDLLHTLITSGLKFGDMNIFHRRLAGESKGPVLFSVANMVNPGVFDLNKMDEFTTLGVSLFLALPTPINNLEAFNQMLNVAQQLCSAMDGDLRDDNRNLMTSQTTEHYRQRIRDFELRRLKAVGARG